MIKLLVYFQIAVYGKGFNKSARDAWELFQSTGVEALVAYDCSGAVLLMGTIFGGLITGSCIGIWAWIKYSDRVIMVASTAMLMGMVLVSFLFCALFSHSKITLHHPIVQFFFQCGVSGGSRNGGCGERGDIDIHMFC